jgi:hypothetical protein
MYRRLEGEINQRMSDLRIVVVEDAGATCKERIYVLPFTSDSGHLRLLRLSQGTFTL